MSLVDNAQTMVKGAITSLVKGEINNYGHAMFILRAQTRVMSYKQKKEFAKWLKIERANHQIKFLDQEINKRFLEIFDVC